MIELRWKENLVPTIWRGTPCYEKKTVLQIRHLTDYVQSSLTERTAVWSEWQDVPTEPAIAVVGGPAIGTI